MSVICVCHTSSHLHIFTSSHLYIFTSSHSQTHIFTSYIFLFTSSHTHIFTLTHTHTSLHLHILTSSLSLSHTHIFTSSHLHSHLHTHTLTSSRTSSHLHILTSSLSSLSHSHLHILTSSLSLSLSPPLFPLSFLSLLSPFSLSRLLYLSLFGPRVVPARSHETSILSHEMRADRQKLKKIAILLVLEQPFCTK